MKNAKKNVVRNNSETDFREAEPDSDILEKYRAKKFNANLFELDAYRKKKRGS